MPTGSLSRHVITADSVGNIYLVPSGSVTTGPSQSVAVAQVVEISMSANTNNYHTPVNDTGSFFLISGSTNPEHFYTVNRDWGSGLSDKWRSPGKKYKDWINFYSGDLRS